MTMKWKTIKEYLNRTADDPSTPDDPLTLLKRILSDETAERVRAECESAIIAKGIPEQVRAEQIEVIRATATLLPEDDPIRVAVESIPE